MRHRERNKGILGPRDFDQSLFVEELPNSAQHYTQMVGARKDSGLREVFDDDAALVSVYCTMKRRLYNSMEWKVITFICAQQVLSQFGFTANTNGH